MRITWLLLLAGLITLPGCSLLPATSREQPERYRVVRTYIRYVEPERRYLTPEQAKPVTAVKPSPRVKPRVPDHHYPEDHKAHSDDRYDNGEPARVMHGVASWYGEDFHGRLTANGEVYNMHRYTAAHRSLPFLTRIRVTNKENGKSLIVRVNDRGPYIDGRVIDLSRAAAKRLGIEGIARVKLEVLPEPADVTRR